MSFPTGIDPTAPAGSDSPGQGDDQFRALKTLLVDLLGLTAGTNNYTAARSVLLPDATLNQWPTAVRLTNGTGATLSRNDVVAVVTTGDSTVGQNNTVGSLLPFVVCADASISNGSAGLFWQTGVVDIATTGTVNRGEYIWKSGTNQLAASSGITASATQAPPPGAFALALAAASGNVCRVLLFGRTYQGTGMGARVYNSAAVNIADNTDTILTFDTERYDLGGLHSTSSNTGRLTTTVAGVYAISGNAEFAAPGAMTAYSQVALHIRLNGTTIIAVSGINGQDAVDTGQELSVSTVYRLAAADYVELIAYQNNEDSTAEDVNATLNTSPEFAIHYLGA